ncbi:ABC transporter ATP-binding protein [Alkalimarinus sediminis]|uniref:ABC transporter ATP-binding protein n=1 Tax=Alkalimarinus sediminis TaxID=1632866 RepID=A0A9E8HJJ8_9ALTE|nr:ABC transporter ATP-binding protein [Alkalimarinus sediminis]UZW75868.1 ABC transporter ATP-binding protein [Alkalimarinus sediminis]
MNNALSIQGLRKVYSNGHEALKGISLDVEQGDFFALLGPNGAGKSTTLGIVSSLVSKTSGRVKIFDYDIDTDLVKAKMQLGVVPQEFNFNQFEKVFDIVVTQAGYYGIPAEQAKQSAEKYLKKLGLWDKRDVASRLLSGGMKRRLMIARALVHEPRILILDEPTAGVDIELRRSMWEFMKELNEQQGTTIILTTHYLEEAESLCRNIAIIDQGKILANTSKKKLLSNLHSETFVLDVAQPITQPLSLPGFASRVNKSGEIEVDIEQGQSINSLFSLLSEASIEVVSIRARANRLEELFVRMVEEGK